MAEPAPKLTVLHQLDMFFMPTKELPLTSRSRYARDIGRSGLVASQVFHLAHSPGRPSGGLVTIALRPLAQAGGPRTQAG